MSTNWVGATGGWNTITNWSGGIPNSGTVDATIATAGSYIVTLEPATTDQVDVLLLDAAGATLNLAGTLLLGGPLTLLDAAAGSIILAGALTGGTLELDPGASLTDTGSFAGNLDAAAGSSINLAGSTLSATGTGFVRAAVTGAGTIALSGLYEVGGLALSGGETALIAAGTVIQDGALTLNSDGAGSTALTIASGATYQINAVGQTLNSAGAATITNAGLFEKANDDGTNFVFASVANTAGGTISVPRGVLELVGGGVLGGTLSGAGTLELTNGTYTLAAARDSLGTLALSGGTVVLGAAQSFAGEFLDIFETLDLGGHNLTLSGSANAFDAAVGGTGGLTLSGSGDLDLVSFGSGVTVTDSGSINQTGNVTFGAFSVAAHADYDLTSDSSLSAQGTILLVGEIEKTAGTGASGVTAAVSNTGLILDLSGALDFTGPITNTGTIESTGPGDITLSSVAGTGQIELISSAADLTGPVSAGQTLTLYGSNDVVTLGDAADFAGTITGFAGGDTLVLAGTSFTPGTYHVSSAGLLTLPVSGGASPVVLKFAAASDGLAITLTAGNGVVDLTTAKPPGTVNEWTASAGDWGNSANWSAGVPNAPSLSASITTASDDVTLGAAETYAVGSLLLENGATLDLAGSLAVSGSGTIAAAVAGPGTLAIGGVYDVGGQSLRGGLTELVTGFAIQNGDATFGSGVRLSIASGGLYEVNAVGDAIVASGPANIINAGLFTKADDPGTTDVNAAITSAGSGTITVPAGILDFLAGGTLGGLINGPGEVLLGGGTFTLAPTSYALGTLGVTGADLVLGASQTLGGDVFTSAGSTISLNGHNLTLSGTSSLAGADVAGTGTINISGTGETSDTSFGSGATLIDTGSINQDGNITFGSGAGFTVSSGATYDIASDSGITSAGTIDLAGTLDKTAGTGTGTITGPVSVTGAVLGASGTIDFTGAVANTGLIESSGAGDITLSTVTGSGTLEMLGSQMTLTGPVGAGQLISFGGSSDVLTLTDPGALAGTISGFGAGDTIVAPNLTLIPGVYTISSTGSLDVPASGGADLKLNFAAGDDNLVITISAHGTGFQATTSRVPCFAAGTRILTVHGECAVEELEAGMMLATEHAGVQPVKWIGTRRYDGRMIAGNRNILPITIKAGAIADGVPARDLTVSPGHAIVLDGALVHAKRLVNGHSIVQAAEVDEVSYFHIELATHEVIFAENCPAETFMDEQFRGQFQNAGTFFTRFPGQRAADSACLPPLSGFALAAAQARLAARAGLAAHPVRAPGALRGYVDQVTPSICAGWACDMANPEMPVALDIWRGDVRVARVLANDFRADLRAAGIGDGLCGFSVKLDPKVTGALVVRRSADQEVLTWTDDAVVEAA